MSGPRPPPKIKYYAYFAIAVAMFVASVIFLLWSVGYMEIGRVATSLMSALAGFTLLTGSLYMFRLSAYVYAAERGEK